MKTKFLLPQNQAPSISATTPWSLTLPPRLKIKLEAAYIFNAMM